MPTSNSTAGGEVMSAAAPFSYAQAAKGKVNSIGSPSQSKKESISWADDSADATTVVEEINNSPVTNGISSKSSEPVLSPSRPSVAEETFEALQSASPDFAASSSTTAKEDDAHSDTKSPSDSAWENKSQSSNSASQTQDAAEERGRSKEKSTERSLNESESSDKILPRALKEAPLPTVNIWQQRAHEAKAKQSFSQQPPKPSNPALPSNIQLHGSGTASGITSDSSQSQNKSQKAGSSPALARRESSGRVGSDEVKSGGPSSQTTKGSRFSRHETSAPRSAPLPSVQDEISWPTPMNAQDEDRRRAQEKGDKTEKDRTATLAAKPHGRNEWKPVAYTPSVKFNTPMPPIRGRGGRIGARGGRGGSLGERNGAIAHISSGTDASVSDGNKREKSEPAAARSLSLPPSSRRPTNANQVLPKDSKVIHEDVSRKQQPSQGSMGASLERISTSDRISVAVSTTLQHVDQEDSGNASNERQAHATSNEQTEQQSEPEQITSESNGNRRKSVATQTDTGFESAPVHRSKRRTSQAAFHAEAFGGEPSERRRFVAENGGGDRSSWVEQRGESSTYSRDRDSHREPWISGSHRERGEGRLERGKGWKSGRGNHSQATHHALTQHHSPSHLPPIQTSSSHPAKGASSYQTQYFSQPGGFASNARGYRNGPRSASIPTEASYGRYNSGFPGSLQYAYSAYPNGVYDYSGMMPMSAVPYNPYVEQALLVGEISSQLTYYFSLENLLKDIFLRSHMDSKGFVALTLIANFKRMKDLTTDVELIKFVCLQSEDYELRVGPDGKDRLRKKDGWEKWVLAMEERDVSAKNEGPSLSEQSDIMYTPGFGQQSYNSSGTAHGRESHIAPLSATVSSFSPLPITPTMNGFHAVMSSQNGDVIGENEIHDRRQSLAPSSRPIPSHHVNDEADSHRDDQTQFLNVLVRPLNSQAQSSSSSTGASTTSSGDATLNDKVSVNDLQSSETPHDRSSSRPNGHYPGEQTQSHQQGAKSPPSQHCPNSSSLTSSVGWYWIRDNEKEKFVPLPSDADCVPYEVLRLKALEQRETAAEGHTPYDMIILYNFWSHFLIRNFNAGMYKEFRQFAQEDMSNNMSHTGMEKLIDYYSKMLASQSPLREQVAADYVELVKHEDIGKARPAFEHLRSAWRNGATDLKNRKRISDFVDAELRAELDR